MHLDDPYERGTQDPSSDNFTPTTSVIGSIHFLVFSLPSIEETSIQGQPSILVLFVLAPSSFSSVLLLTGCSSALTTTRKVVDASKHSSRTRKAAADDENIENEDNDNDLLILRKIPINVNTVAFIFAIMKSKLSSRSFCKKDVMCVLKLIRF